ncbi:SDR family NAD(P)-dependent oxidoreductase [Helicobacter mustelae]|uniref:NADP-dependent L-serine/L-allo-threonine dehydrogenase n=1 Tax=Helicobacter mustelae (strain ATCC 43772 / CCUG 25715 / CIP 103759 / LMG 18044 / NCTC 12198 / R85-136P) TaxID=679897 RepID=D3UHW6_HELM1|nr:SDR family NAD(P)-dependent oxidoreductase [Helicobacter mustelae]CBG40089.1 NADP-dependent L-serine/L-allo-threonine dehydrogenase [Helicobacter mustelae 12198]SQH71603.1 NADP-dependent L-serine/L-allo-threonine dehydrogenase [Helicobacter mustelae]
MRVLITGASVGFGAEIAKKFSANDHEVILLARRKERLLALQKELGKNCVGILAQDINDFEKLRANLEDFAESIDVLINNAGLALGIEPAYECELADWERMIETNVLSLIRLTHFLLPHMIKRQRGHIINIGSIAGSYPYPGSNVYGATKAFLKQFSLNLRADLLGKNIRVSNIEPGLSGGSEFSLVRFKGEEKRAYELYEGAHPLMPEDIAEAVFWCASLPEHVNINRIELMPTTQAPAGLSVHKDKG